MKSKVEFNDQITLLAAVTTHQYMHSFNPELEMANAKHAIWTFCSRHKSHFKVHANEENAVKHASLVFVALAITAA